MRLRIQPIPETRPETSAGRAFWAFETLLSAEGDRLRLTRPNRESQAAAIQAELAEWLLGTMPDDEADDSPADFPAAGPDLWREYLHEDIPLLFGAVSVPATGTPRSSGWTTP